MDFLEDYGILLIIIIMYVFRHILCFRFFLNGNKKYESVKFMAIFMIQIV